ncbi:ubiquitin carboxyl-terminal hydrolase CYLD-like isoform X2 [Heptranchias perlo]
MEAATSSIKPACALYILTKDQAGRSKVARGSLLTADWEQAGRSKVTKGGLLTTMADREQGGQPRKGPLRVRALEWGEALTVEERDVRELDRATFDLLGAVTDPEERLAMSRSEQRLAWLASLRTGARVRVQITSSSKEKALGVVRFRGPIAMSKPLSATYFGIELLGAASKKGFTDGMIQGRRFFSCGENGGVFVPASRLETAEEGDREASWPGLEIGSKVFVKLDNTSQFGIVKFCDVVPGKAENGVLVGIELDNPVGGWNGRFNGRQLCTFSDSVYGIILPLVHVHL